MLVICEGEKTEKNYFSSYRSIYRLNIEIKPSPNRDAIGIVRYGQKMVEKYGLDLENGDEAWCVFDVDDNNDKMIAEALEVAGPIKTAISNPCFEVWFLLHFEYRDRRIDGGDEAVKILSKHIPDYCKSKEVFPLIAGSTNEAIENSKRLNKHHEGQGKILTRCECNPST